MSTTNKPFILSVVKLNAVMLSVVMLSVLVPLNPCKPHAIIRLG